MHSTYTAEYLQDQAADWPDFPAPLKEGVGARIGNVLFAGLGTAERRWFSLDIQADVKVWRACAAFPFAVRNGAVAVAALGKVYVFGGCGRAPEQGALHQFDSIACYDPQSDEWSELPVRLPVGLLGASAVVFDHSIYFFGGYNKEQFDQFCREHEAATSEQKAAILWDYMDRSAPEFEWNNTVWKFEIDACCWRDLGRLPHAPTCGSAVIVDGEDVLLVSGEIKPGLRTPAIQRATVRNGVPLWRAEHKLPPCNQPQEGVAAAFAGKCGIVKVVAGGTNFVGARARYASGQAYAHQGLPKLWRDEIYVLRNETWEVAGYLPQGRATGLAFEVEQGLLLVGGDTQNGSPCLETWLLSYDESAGITIQRSKLN